MPAGRPPKPTAIKLAEGRSPGRDSGGRKVEPAPSFKHLPPQKPDDLSSDAAELWDSVIDEFTRLDLVRDVDGGALRSCCEAWASYRAAVRMRQEYGLVTWGKNGDSPRVAPWVRVEESAGREFRQWCNEFGLTPAAETKLAKGNKDNGEHDNPFAAAG